MDFSKINEVSNKEYLPVKRLIDLEVGAKYMLTAIRKVKTEFGKKVVVEIDEEFQVFLPARVCDSLYEFQNMFDDLEAKVNKLELFLHYNGNRRFEFCT